MSRWEVQLAGPAAAPIPLTAPHAVVSRWLDDPPGRRAPGAAGLSGHADQVRKWACGPLTTLPVSETLGTVARIALQVRAFDDCLADRLGAAARAGTLVRLGGGDFQITEPPALIDQASWQSLRDWPGARAWQVRFLTPACFRRGNRTSPWPAPETLARGLADRWRRLDPKTAPAPPAPGPSPVWVSDIDGRSEVSVLARQRGSRHRDDEVISGFTGRIRYACDHGAADEAAAFHALLAFAAFAGVGSHTAYGFGVICPEPTWQPPTIQTSDTA